jgi:Tat protein secretion system quality control protein TatD with DNase activity
MGVRQPTVSRNTSLGREFHRSATWQEGSTTVSVTVIAFVTGIRTRKNPDGSEDLLDQVTRFDVLRKDEYVKPVERAVFLWKRERDGVHDTAIDYSNEIGLFYSATLEDAEEQCRIFVENLDFSEQFDPAAWV